MNLTVNLLQRSLKIENVELARKLCFASVAGYDAQNFLSGRAECQG